MHRCFPLLMLLLSAASAQAVNVQVLTDAAIPTNFGTAYIIGQTRNDAYVYGPSFLIGVSYSLPTDSSLSFNLSGSQPHYLLAWTMSDSGIDHPFNAALGSAVIAMSGSQSNVYYRNDGSLQTGAGDATRYKIGVRSTPSATQDLNTSITLTVTTN